MGMLITVTEKPSARRDVVRFELNRAITGMGHDRYRSRAEAEGSRPPDELARRLFDCGGVSTVTVHGNQVTVELEPGASTDGMAEAIADLFTYYRPGVLPSIP
jgi:hypothetical protein